MSINPFRKYDREKLRRSSSILNKPSDYGKIVNQRLYIFSIIIIVCFSVVIIQLVNIQVRKNTEYTAKLESYTSKKQVFTTPRGQMLDRSGNLVVESIQSHDITYFPPKDITESEEWELAEEFAKTFDISADGLTDTDLKNLYIRLHLDENGNNDYANNLWSEDEYKVAINGSEEEKAQMDALKLERITSEMINDNVDETAKKTFVVKMAMEKSPENESKVIISYADNEKVAYLIEHKTLFKGFDVDFGSWKRNYPYESTFRDVLGNVTSNKQGIPEESQEYYKAKGYSINERVGNSGLEKQYEDLLRGTRRVSEISYDEDGIAIFNEIIEGKKGYDLQLTVDMELQQKVDDILKTSLEKNKNNTQRPDYKKAFVVLMDPNTGDIYSMSGMMIDESGNITNYSSGAYLDSNAPGSIVKGATVYMGLNEGVIKPGEIINDAPMHIQGTPPKASYRNYGPVSDVDALVKSSNVYMFNIAMRLGGTSYIPNGPLLIDNPSNTFSLMRNYYSQFGLGIKTGIDIPNEKTGFIGYSQDAGKLLDFAIGQYDTYTPLQIAQYASTIANHGKKIQPRLVKSAYDVNTKDTIYENKVTFSSNVFGNHDYFNRVEQGFRGCVTSNNCGADINAVGHEIAAKTGTAEVYVDGKPSVNTALIGYGPTSSPKVAFACIAPTSNDVMTNLPANICTSEIMGPVLTEFFKKY